MDPNVKDRLIPGESVPSRLGQIWDPTLGAYRAQRLPLALSKSSVAANAMNGHVNGQKIYRPTTSVSYASTASNSNSFNTAYTYSSTPTSPGSLFSHHSNSTSQLRAQWRPPPRVPFQNLPPEVYDYILQQLRVFHEDPRSQSCQTCHMRDLCSLSMTSRAWDKAVVKRLYKCVDIVGHESKENIKKYKMKTGVRLKLLRRTLRERTFLAQIVRELKIPTFHMDGDSISREMIDIVASIVMACPNFERLVGFYPLYTHEFDRLTHALSTRRKLKEQVWLIGENAAITQRSQRQLAPGLMDPDQKASFVQYHNAWSSLTTLFLHSPAQGILEKDIFVNMKKNLTDPRFVRGPGILHRLPSLKHLCISSFDMDDFDDRTLQLLPPLHSLRLQDLEGVTFWGLSEYSRTKSAFALRALSLINLDITYISAISNLLLHLKNLKRFSLMQDSSPAVATDEIIIHPLIASNTLTYLHWEIPLPGSANLNLANSIRAAGFPKLLTLRAPCDHDGLLQALCKPRATTELPSDYSTRYINALPIGSLRAARRAAQERIEEAWGKVQFKVIVEEGGFVKEIFDFQGFIGTIGSRIRYCLEPDVEGSDVALVNFGDLTRGERREGGGVGGVGGLGGVGGTGGGKERATGMEKEMCKGEWNARHPDGLKWWGHSERPRWRGVELERFF